MRLKPLTHVRLIEWGRLEDQEDVIRHLIDRMHQEISPGRFIGRHGAGVPVADRVGRRIRHSARKIPGGPIGSSRWQAGRPIRDWESLDPDNEVDLVFLLAIPERKQDRPSGPAGRAGKRWRARNFVAFTGMYNRQRCTMPG